MFKNKKLVFGIAVTILLLIIGSMLFRNSANREEEATQIPTSQIIPTVDGSVIVELEQASKKGEVTLSIKSAPAGTKSIEYTLSYDAQGVEGAEGPVPQGAIGKCDKSGTVWKCGEPAAGGRKIVLGTCSSGVCRYHNIVGKINVALKFSGSYGERLFEKDYEL